MMIAYPPFPRRSPDALATYAGIGSRATPPEGLALITELAAALARCRVTLRSGGAPGADAAFEAGCDLEEGKKEIYLPWSGFNGNTSPLDLPPPEAFILAGQVHPRWGRCLPSHRRLHARNCQQVLGRTLTDPVDFVLFWAEERDGEVYGGIATAIRLARSLEIPTYNLWLPEVRMHWMVRMLRRPVDEATASPRAGGA